eukprot:scaffold61704_cov24-Attheya_sp.AAC.1
MTTMTTTTMTMTTRRWKMTCPRTKRVFRDRRLEMGVIWNRHPRDMKGRRGPWKRRDSWHLPRVCRRCDGNAGIGFGFIIPRDPIME